jgi:plasmid stabilization system protein ParE
MRSLILRPEAEAEVEEAYRWYEKQSAGLGTEFLRVVDAVMEAIRRQPELYPVKYKSARQVVVRRFPYCIYYIIQPDGGIEVISCFHTSKNPRRWRSRA